MLSKQLPLPLLEKNNIQVGSHFLLCTKPAGQRFIPSAKCRHVLPFPCYPISYQQHNLFSTHFEIKLLRETEPDYKSRDMNTLSHCIWTSKFCHRRKQILTQPHYSQTTSNRGGVAVRRLGGRKFVPQRRARAALRFRMQDAFVRTLQ